MRNEPQRSGEAEHFATRGAAGGSKANIQREEERLSAKRGSGGTPNSEMSEAILNVVVKRCNDATRGAAVESRMNYEVDKLSNQ